MGGSHELLENTVWRRFNGKAALQANAARHNGNLGFARCTLGVSG
jgi:hypothetical protein